MMYGIQIQPLPESIQVKYLVLRGNGDAKLFDSLHPNLAATDLWEPTPNKRLDSNCVMIPLDVFTALQLRLVTFEELLLPSGAEALFRLIR